MDLIKIAEEAFATGKQHPSFKAGDTVTVAYRTCLREVSQFRAILIVNPYFAVFQSHPKIMLRVFAKSTHLIAQ